MKTLALIARRRDIDRTEFRDHYEEIHAPLAVRTLLEGATRYVRHHLRDELFGRPAFDVVTGFWYRDAAAAVEIMRRTETPAGDAIRRDELTFMDKPANTFFAVTEHVVRGAEDRGAGFAAVALVRRPSGQELASFVEAYERDSVPALLDAVRSPVWCMQNRALRFGAADPAFDVVTQIHAAGDASGAKWAQSLAATGASVVLATVTEHESDLSAIA
jgi:EthD domain